MEENQGIEAAGGTIEGYADLPEIVQKVANENNWTDNYKDQFISDLDKFLNECVETLADRGHFQLRRFGSFKLQVLPPESGTTPQGKPYSVGPRLRVKFNTFQQPETYIAQIRRTPFAKSDAD